MVSMTERIEQISHRLTRVEGAVLFPTGTELPSIEAVIRFGSFLFQEPARAIKGDARHQGVTRARFAICFVANQVLGLSLARIGRVLGDRDHTTIRSAVIRARQLRDADPEYRDRLDRMVAVFQKEELPACQQQ